MSNVEKKKNTIVKDAAILFVITIIAGFALGFVHEITLPAIQLQQENAKIAAYQKVFPEAKEFQENEDLTVQVTRAPQVLSDNGYDKVTVDEAVIATDGGGNKIGYVVTVTTQEGYKGGIKVSIGYGMDGVVKGMEVLTINETAGLGAKAAENDFKGQFVNKATDKFEYTKTGATADNQIDAISGATITTSAVVNEVNAGICFITECVEAGNTLGGK
jgi:electron transport complex protein RnfG